MAAPKAPEISLDEARALRMSSLLLRDGSAGSPSSVAEVVTWMGAMQSQDLASGLWSFGSRLPDMTAADVEQALERPEALRTWPMRGTVHFVPPRDARWMLAVLGERPLAAAAKRREYIGLTEGDADRAVEVLGEALTGGKRMTRAECTQTLLDAGIDSAGQLTYHILWYASQRGVTCIAPNVGNEQTFVLLDEWVPDPVKLDRDEALATIALRFFQSHGPTTRQNFSGWIGSTAPDAKLGIAGCGDALASVRVDGVEMILARESLDAPSPATMADDEYRALPGFDEFLLGFKERSMVLEPEHLQAVIPGKNGVFRATIVRGGRVVATWKRTLSKQQVIVEVWPFAKLRVKDKRAVEASLEPYARFLERKLEVRWPTGARNHRLIHSMNTEFVPPAGESASFLGFRGWGFGGMLATRRPANKTGRAGGGGTAMFMQVIQGKVRDADLLNSQIEKWAAEVKPGAAGYLGRTSGITSDGQSVAMVRFESEKAAQANSERPEQAAWWEATAKAFDGEPTFINCTEVDEMMGGGSNEAGFVQIMQGRSNDPNAMRAGGQSMEDDLQKMRPDILGGVVGWHGDNNFIQAIYFKSEEAARSGESTMSDDPSVEEWEKLIDGPMTFLDLTDPAFD